VDINADGILATSGFGSLRLWDAHTGAQVTRIPLASAEPSWGVFSADGDHLLYVDTTDAGYVLRRFPLDPDRLIALAESRVTRGLTADECRRYLDAATCE
jgi:hypothetical protein